MAINWRRRGPAAGSFLLLLVAGACGEIQCGKEIAEPQSQGRIFQLSTTFSTSWPALRREQAMMKRSEKLQPELVTRVLLEQRIRFDLGLRDREQYSERCVGCFGVPRSRGELAEANQIHPALAFRRELEQPLFQN